jgi:spore coat-associated protein N
MSIIQRNKKVAAGIGVAAAAAAAIALGTGTFAAFSTTAAGPGGTLAAGTIALQVNGGASAANLLEALNLYPTQIVNRAVTVKNVSGVTAILSGTEVISNEIDSAGDGAWLKYQLQQSSSCTSISGTKTTGPTLVKDVSNTVGVGFEIPAGETATCTFTFVLPDQADNNLVQGDSIRVDSSFTLTQKITP